MRVLDMHCGVVGSGCDLGIRWEGSHFGKPGGQSDLRENAPMQVFVHCGWGVSVTFFGGCPHCFKLCIVK